jgi:hypothetical protein
VEFRPNRHPGALERQRTTRAHPACGRASLGVRARRSHLEAARLPEAPRPEAGITPRHLEVSTHHTPRRRSHRTAPACAARTAVQRCCPRPEPPSARVVATKEAVPRAYKTTFPPRALARRRTLAL